MTGMIDDEKLDMLTSFTGADADVAARVLRKHGGDVDRAMNALLDGDTAPEAGPVVNVTQPAESAPAPPPSPTQAAAAPPQNELIDLTMDSEEDELKKAMEMSMQTETPPTFSKSERAPDPNWAMVSSNAPIGPSHEDESLSRAIEASLSTSYLNFEEEALPVVPEEDWFRKDDRPSSIRTTKAPEVYAAVALHALFFVPQLRDAISTCSRSCIDESSNLDDDPYYSTFLPVLRIFSEIDLSVINGTLMDKYIEATGVLPLAPSEDVGDRTGQYLNEIMRCVLGFLGRNTSARYGDYKTFFRAPIVRMNVPAPNPPLQPLLAAGPPPPAPSNDLVSNLLEEVASADEQGGALLAAPEEIVFFQLVRPPPEYGTTKDKDRRPFGFPARFYVDPFLESKRSITRERRRKRAETEDKVLGLGKKREELTRFDGKDNLRDLRAAVHYYENVAMADDPAKKAAIQQVATELKQILTKVEQEVEAISSEVKTLREEVAHALDIPELQEHQYDLRAVLVHDGLLGRNHLYSYVRYHRRWWKVVDYVVTEVTEDVVLGDSTGLHLGAGPYMLMYSRALSEEVEKQMEEPVFYEPLAKDVQEQNATVISQLPQGYTQLYNPGEHRAPPAKKPSSSGSMRRILKGALNSDHSSYKMDTS